MTVIILLSVPGVEGTPPGGPHSGYLMQLQRDIGGWNHLKAGPLPWPALNWEPWTTWELEQLGSLSLSGLSKWYLSVSGLYRWSLQQGGFRLGRFSPGSS